MGKWRSSSIASLLVIIITDISHVLHLILMIDFKLLADCGVHVSFISILSFHSANEIGFYFPV